jgi:translocation protein SEC62
MEAQAQASPTIIKVANFLRTGNAGMKMRVGALNGKRIDYFKGVCVFFSCLVYYSC